MIDVIIPTHVKDIETLELCIEGVKRSVIGLNKIYVISKDKLTDNAEWIPESAFPFSLVEVSDIIGETWRTTWYYQQVLKFYAHEACEELLDNYMTVDSDTIFLRPIDFINKENNSVYMNYNVCENYQAYFEHMFKLVPGLNKFDEKSGVTHSMVFSRDVLDELKKTVELNHGHPLWYAFFDITNHHYHTLRDQSHAAGGRASEFEIYFNYIRRFFPHRVQIRKLNSILAYKGNLYHVENGVHSRTNSSPSYNVFDVPDSSEFTDLEESFRYVIRKAKDEGYDSVTFQKHTRQDFQHYKSDSINYLKETLNDQDK